MCAETYICCEICKTDHALLSHCCKVFPPIFSTEGGFRHTFLPPKFFTIRYTQKDRLNVPPIKYVTTVADLEYLEVIQCLRTHFLNQ